jgi:tRNA U55 pseudouridine synthase TruB
MAISVLDSCAYLDKLERTRQGPFETKHCLTEEECTVQGISNKILEMRQLTHEYLKVQNKIKYDVKQKYRFESGGVKTKHDQWDYAK